MYEKRRLRAQGSRLGDQGRPGQRSGSRRAVDLRGPHRHGFDERELQRVSKLLKARAIARSPFANPIKSNETAHWVTPDLVAQVRFTEWTDDGKLRHPVYLGLRDDKDARSVVEEEQRCRAEARAMPGLPRRSREGARPPAPSRAKRGRRVPASIEKSGQESANPSQRRSRNSLSSMQPVVDQLQALEDARRDGAIALPDGSRMSVTNLAKLFWPKLKLTKGDLLRYYATVAPFILPVVADRPLVMKRFPNGVDDPVAFYQQRKQKEQPPAGVRIEVLPPDIDPIDEPGTERFIGGSLITLLYMTQLAAISQDPWFSRVQSPMDADYVAIDLDPGDGATFAQVRDVACWVRDELEALQVPAFPKTSGSRGLHIYIPLPAEHLVRIGSAVLSDSGDGCRQQASEGGDRRTHGQEAPARHGLRRLSPEHPRQDARDGLQRAGQRVCGRVDAARVGGNRFRSRPEGLHHRHRTVTVSRGRRSVGATANVKARSTRTGLREVLGESLGTPTCTCPKASHRRGRRARRETSRILRPQRPPR